MVGHRRDTDRQAESVDHRTIGHGEPVRSDRGRQSLADLATFFSAIPGKEQKESTFGLRQHDVIPTKQSDEESANRGGHSVRGAATRPGGECIEVVELADEHRGMPKRRASVQ
jgi:hypothetical protein